MEEPRSLNVLIAEHFEWLAVRDSGRTLPLRRDEIEITDDGRKTLFGFTDEKGFSMRRVVSFDVDGDELSLELSGRFGSEAETVRLIPRTSAAELSANIELARLEKANEAARIIVESFAGYTAERIQLNTSNGRLAQIFLRGRDKVPIGVMYDVTAALTHETILTSAIKWLDKLRIRKKDPITDIWIVAEKRQAGNLQKLLALLRPSVSGSISVVEIVRSTEKPTAKFRRQLSIAELWREKPKKLSIPSEIIQSRTARAIIDISPDSIDVVFSKQGETLRFNGLPFARVRRLMGTERAWFGVERARRPLTRENWIALEQLIRELAVSRVATSVNRRNELFRLASEAWLESILRRNIKLLDANLELAPIYNQFRSSNDKIDLLAIRKDGRLVVIELKTSPDRESVFQAADYWRKIELQRRRGVLREARLFGDKDIIDKPLLVYMAAPALSFHRDWEYFAKMLSPEIELWRWELHEDWRAEIKVIARINCSDQ
jgi:hypothetical protein